ncbi:bifunctional precorrin-2 dehydrogenase/sirohydrochlorin ferrochelatase [uncultured Dysosmobacter sp.]|uniref:precorrin-2 dehydrogenase/sirohydrochlorin ferrochelatase family protein n=1 Tax=uncultured Dysosmobacter sp. TaxID=2591384 RepID=UPI0026299332|nr:bifunctional precorrin-2 dehydrogenase/sirohydrochlorin ferrochelatase [uncultured Dysosmobacter sp.]
MGYFPFFVELSEKQGLIVGGGTVALRKVQKLLPYGPRLAVAAPELHGELRTICGLELRERPFVPEDLEGCDFVIAATDDHALNHRIAALCRERGILVNVADCKEDCTFLFPALVKRGDLSVGISTSGAGPTAAIYFKERIADLLPERLEEILAYLEAARETVKDQIPEESRRRQLLRELFDECMRAGGPLPGTALPEKLQAAQEVHG